MKILLLMMFIIQSSPGDTVYLSISRAVQIGLKNNLSLRAKTTELNMSKMDIRKAKSAFFPTISGQATYTRLSEVQKSKMLTGFHLTPTGDPQMPYIIIPEFTDIQTTYYNNYGLGISISQPIFTWGIIRKSYELSKEQYKNKLLEIKSEKLKLEEQIKENYYNLLLAEKSLDVLNQVKKELEDNYNSTKERYDAGYASDFELLRAEVQLKNIDPQIEQLKGQIKIAKDAFKNLIGLPESTAIVLTDSVSFQPLSTSPDSLIKQAYNEHEDLKLFQKNIELLRQTVTIQRKKNRPTVFYNWSYKYQKPFGMTDEWHGMWTFTLGLSWNIFDGGANKADVAKLNYQIKSLEFSYQNLKDAIALMIRSYYTNAKSLEKILKAQEANLKLARRAYKMAETQYKEGYLTSLDVINAQVQYSQARLNYLKTLIQYQISLIQLEYAVKGGISKTSQGGMR